MAEKWQVEFLRQKAFEKVLSRFSISQRNQIFNRIIEVLADLGPDSVASGQAKPLGGGLYELRIAMPPDVLLRVFFTTVGGRVIVILSAYDKKSNDSKSWQNLQISNARRLMKSLDK